MTGRKGFSDNNEVSSTRKGYFKDLDVSAYQSSINALEHIVGKSISEYINGDYV